MTSLQSSPRRLSPGRIESTLRRRRAVSDRIQAAAVELLARHAYHEVTVEEIAVAAGVSPRTFFRYFACKDDVVLHAWRSMVAAVGEAVGRRPADEGLLDALRAAYLSVVADADSNALRGQARALASVPPLQAQAAGEHCAGRGPLVAAVADRMGVDATTDLRPALLAAATTAAVGVALARWAAGTAPDPVPAVAAALDVVAAGTLPPAPPGAGQRAAATPEAATVGR